MELEPSTNFTPSVDHRPRIPEPLPVRLITVADATLLTRAGIKAELDAFYVGLFGFEAEADERDLETDATVLVYRAENFRLRFSVLDPPVRREDLRPLGIEVPSLPDAEQKLVEAEIEYGAAAASCRAPKRLFCSIPLVTGSRSPRAGAWVDETAKRGVSSDCLATDGNESREPMFAGKPVIGIVGGIGSGKSFVASLFGELGCRVIDSDAQVRDAYRDPDIKATLKQWWGDGVFLLDGQVNRSAIAARVFSDPMQRQRLEQLIHPWVARARDAIMQKEVKNPQTVAFVWDTPLLLEAGLGKDCDSVVFVDAPLDLRLARVRQNRGWRAEELARRENLQWPLDKKREISEYVVSNTADAGAARSQVRAVLSRILAGLSPTPPGNNAGQANSDYQR